MKVRHFLCQLDTSFSFCNIDITIVSVLKTIVKIQTTPPCQTPLNSRLCTYLTNILMPFFLLIFSGIKRIFQLYPHIRFYRFTWHIKLSSQSTS